jgi:mitosis inhibitor protein kinase SWE1
MFFSGPASSSFTFEAGTPMSSPRSSGPVLPKKFKPRDSGVCLSGSEEESFRADLGLGLGPDSGVPSASTSLSTAASSGSDLTALVTPLFGSTETSGWPTFIHNASDDLSAEDGGLDAYVLRALQANAKPPPPGDVGPTGGKRAPGTPVKKVKTAFVGGGRPWQSAFAPGKIGLPFMNDSPEAEMEMKAGKAGRKKPRASLPAAFPVVEKIAAKGKGLLSRGMMGMNGFSPASSTTTTSTKEESESEGEGEGDGETMSPSASRDAKYTGLGMGRPLGGMAQRARWLMRRSSSGQFESGSESTGSAGTPTRLVKKGKFYRRGMTSSSVLTDLPGQSPRIPVPQFSPPSAGGLFGRFSGHNTSGSQSGSVSSVSTALNSPTTAKAGPGQNKLLPVPQRPLRHRQSSVELFQRRDRSSAQPFALALAAATGHDYDMPVSTPTNGGFSFPSMEHVGMPLGTTNRSMTGSTNGSINGSPVSPPRAPIARVRMSSMCGAEARPGRFEREFVECDEVGKGEFGSVYRVRRKVGGQGEWAVKKSARFEGARQR